MHPCQNARINTSVINLDSCKKWALKHKQFKSYGELGIGYWKLCSATLTSLLYRALAVEVNHHTLRTVRASSPVHVLFTDLVPPFLASMDPRWFEAFHYFKNLPNYGFCFVGTVSAQNVCQKWTFAAPLDMYLLSGDQINKQALVSFGHPISTIFV